ncbi:long-chain fatty acid transport protein 4-like [Glandiceps talaboti]
MVTSVNVFSAARLLRRVVDALPGWKMVLKAVALGGLATALRYNGHTWWHVILAVLIVYIIISWRFVVIAVRTFPRDYKALVALIGLQLRLRQMKRTNKLVPGFFRDLVAKHPHKIALRYEGRSWTYQEMEEYSNRMANYFYEAGYKKDDVVAIFMESRPEFLCMWLGLAKIGVIGALINFNLRMDSLAHCIAVSNARGLIYGTELTDAIRDVKNLIPKQMVLFCSGEYKNETLSAVDLDHKLQKSSSIPAPVVPNRLLTDKLFYIYTSGTTGLPKAAIITHARFVYMADGMYKCFHMRPDDVIYCTLPLYHSAGGIVGAGQTIINGVTTVIRKKFSASRFWDDCIEYNCTIIQYIGEICRYLLAQPTKAAEQQHRIRMAIGNGLRPQIWDTFVKRFNIPQIAEFYGSTEGNANIVNIDGKPGAVGFNSRIVPWAYPIKLVLVDEDSGELVRDPRTGLCQQCEPGQPGELVGKIIKGDPTREFHGYVDPKATTKKVGHNVFRKGDMVFLSGDVLTMDELGYMYFRDRSGDTFRWKGENVSTSEVEGTVSRILHLRDVAVYGVEIPGVEGRCGMAAIVDDTNTLDLSILSHDLKQQLPSYARPMFLRLMESVDTTGTFKLIKGDLKREAFNPNIVTDKLFYMEVRSGEYKELNKEAYNDISSGKIRM